MQMARTTSWLGPFWPMPYWWRRVWAVRSTSDRSWALLMDRLGSAASAWRMLSSFARDASESGACVSHDVQKFDCVSGC